MTPNFTFLILAGTNTSIEKTIIKAANIGIYGIINLFLNETILTSSGLGCIPASGAGCGFIDSIIGLAGICGGTGGSYGGQGLNSLSITSELSNQANSIC